MDGSQSDFEPSGRLRTLTPISRDPGRKASTTKRIPAIKHKNTLQDDENLMMRVLTKSVKRLIVRKLLVHWCILMQHLLWLHTECHV
jgi:hypothetical protein